MGKVLRMVGYVIWGMAGVCITAIGYKVTKESMDKLSDDICGASGLKTNSED